MAYTRYNGNVVPFAKNSTTTNRTVFGSTTQSDNINDNLNDNFKLGWQVVPSGDNPPKQWFNAFGYTATNLIAYLYQSGVPEWNASQEYTLNSYVQGSDGIIYKSLVSSNIGNSVTDTSKWRSIHSIFNLDIDGATDIGTNLADTDLIMVDNGANGTNRKSAISRIWTYIGGKLTGAISTVTTSNLTTNRALASDGSGKIGVSTATSTELGYLSGVTSGVQTQINNKVAKATMTDNSVVRANGTAGEVQGSGVIINDSDNVGIGTPPSAWPTSSNVNALHLNRDGVIYSGSAFNNNYIGIGSGYYYDSSFTPTRKNNVASSEYVQYAGSHYWKTAPSGTAGSAITWINTMTLDSTGNLTVAGTITSNSKTVLTDFAHSFSANGYQKLSNGLIIQWGTMPLTGDNINATITFPISFPNSCVSIVPSIDTVSTGAGNWSVYAKTTSNFSANYSSTVTNSSGGYYIAIGY